MEDKKKIILIVDDELPNINVYRAILNKHGYRVYGAQDGAHALDMVKKHSPHLILLDLLMPNVHGFDVLKQIRANEEYNGIKIIIMSGVYTNASFQLQARQEGAIEFMAKPIDPPTLLERVKEHLLDV